ncbi:MAG: type II toxin-antitoxin system RelB/DinJ family antitoxin [Firmicutes bacterium]|nr:type II toxin-antitoxin system RelB/DinJ family antitoxin [Bacillota bacterium]
MAKTSVLHARLDENLKQNVERILNEIGLTPSDAVNLFYRQVELNGGLPFELKIPNYGAERRTNNDGI